MTCAGLLHIRHVHTRRSLPGITFLAKTCNDGGRALGVVDIGAACPCNGEQCERGCVARLHDGPASPAVRLISSKLTFSGVFLNPSSVFWANEVGTRFSVVSQFQVRS